MLVGIDFPRSWSMSSQPLRSLPTLGIYLLIRGPITEQSGGRSIAEAARIGGSKMAALPAELVWWRSAGDTQEVSVQLGSMAVGPQEPWCELPQCGALCLAPHPQD